MENNIISKVLFFQDKELTTEQEEYIWEVKNFHPQSKEENNEENYQFLKNLYWDLILFHLKKLDLKTAEMLEKGWLEVNNLFMGKTCG
jgi:hemerythrin